MSKKKFQVKIGWGGGGGGGGGVHLLEHGQLLGFLRFFLFSVSKWQQQCKQYVDQSKNEKKITEHARSMAGSKNS